MIDHGELPFKVLSWVLMRFNLRKKNNMMPHCHTKSSSCNKRRPWALVPCSSPQALRFANPWPWFKSVGKVWIILNYGCSKNVCYFVIFDCYMFAFYLISSVGICLDNSYRICAEPPQSKPCRTALDLLVALCPCATVLLTGAVRRFAGSSRTLRMQMLDSIGA